MMGWSAGIAAPDFLRGIDGLASDRRNQLPVRPAPQNTRDEAIFAFGDCAPAWQAPARMRLPRR
jgi:NADH dehydrogenase